MISIISSAKTLDFNSKDLTHLATRIVFPSKTNFLLDLCKKLSVNQIQKLMKLSDKLSELTYQRFQSFENQKEKEAIFAYKGDVYENINVRDFTTFEIEFIQNHISIISGLYGILKPLDYIKPYRLEMSLKLNNKVDLVKFWQEDITNYINTILATHKNKFLINLASKEYSAVIDSHILIYPMINIYFKENSNNKLQTIGLNAKKARGKMINFIIKNQIDTINALKEFEVNGYKFTPSASSERDLVFIKE